MTRTDAPRTDATPSSTANPATSTALADMDITGTLIERMRIEVTELSAERVVATMPVEGNTQPAGLLHGGATAADFHALCARVREAVLRTSGIELASEVRFLGPVLPQIGLINTLLKRLMQERARSADEHAEPLLARLASTAS